ncbi:MAG: hypothetical protein KAQ67_04890 [Gammaproteobacteria bacterium]|nr:hypothetical protein [Gammaproteobacteria bacterium]
MIVINIILALTAVAFWYMTGNWWLATVGVLAAVLVKDEWYLIVILLTAAIGYVCIYYILRDAGMYLNKESLEILGITFFYFTAALIRAKLAFSG